MAKSAASSNPVTAAINQAVQVGVMAKSTCDELISNYASTYPDELEDLLTAIRNGSIIVLERR